RLRYPAPAFTSPTEHAGAPEIGRPDERRPPEDSRVGLGSLDLRRDRIDLARIDGRERAPERERADERGAEEDVDHDVLGEIQPRAAAHQPDGGSDEDQPERDARDRPRTLLPALVAPRPQGDGGGESDARDGADDLPS